MSKRSLPQRSTRGQLPAHLRQQPQPPKNIRIQSENEEERQRKDMQAKRKMTQLLNLKKYPFARAIHYYFNLDQLPRAPSTVSYAINEVNVLQHTYSKDRQLINGSPIGELVNRYLIGLPINLTGQLPLRKQNKCKNVCYAYLFQIQDKKHNNDRIIYSIKAILKKLPKMTLKELQKYDFIKKDNDLQYLLNENLSIAQKKEILENKMYALQVRKETNSINWKFEDTVLFYHALNQRLHNSVIELKSKLSEEYLYRLLFEKESLHYDFTHAKIAEEEYIDKMTRYYHWNISTLSRGAIKSLIAFPRASLLITNTLTDRLLSTYPIAILHFSKNETLHSLSEFLISRRAFSMGEVHFYQVKTMVKKLFKRDIKLKTEKIISYDQYYKNFRKRYEEICRFKKSKLNAGMQNHFNYPLLDQYLSDSFKKGQDFNLFKLSQSIEITKKQFIFLMIYFWLSQILASLHPYLLQFNDLLEIIGSDYYPKVCNPLVEAIGTPMAGFIFYIFEALTDLLSKYNPLPNINTNLLLQYDAKLNVCMIYHGEANLSQLDSQKSEQKPSSKKIKRV